MELVEDSASSSRLLRDAAALAYVDNLEEPLLNTDDAHHFSVVLRLRPGEVVIAADGAGSYMGCRVALQSGTGPGGGAGSGGGRRPRNSAVSLVPDTEVMAARRAVPGITVGFSLAKSDRTDWAVAKLAELGVDRILPLVCDRTVARSLGATACGKRADRLRRIAREASMLSRRLWLPEVDDPQPLEEALSALRAPDSGPAITSAESATSTALALGSGVALAEPGGAPLSLATPIVLVGPEGGWSPEELAEGLPRVQLGDTILRVETAAVVAGALLTCLRSGAVAPSEPRRVQSCTKT